MTSLTTIDPHLKIELCTIQEKRDDGVRLSFHTYDEYRRTLYFDLCARVYGSISSKDEITCSLELIVRTNICTESNIDISLFLNIIVYST